MLGLQKVLNTVAFLPILCVMWLGASWSGEHVEDVGGNLSQPSIGTQASLENSQGFFDPDGPEWRSFQEEHSILFKLKFSSPLGALCLGATFLMAYGTGFLARHYIGDAGMETLSDYFYHYLFGAPS